MTNEKSKVSVIIPVYNREAVVSECVRSVQNQTWQDFEIILIDDGSTDETLSICRLLAEEDERIRLLTTEHAGVSAARNEGLSAAEGKYIFFLDSDDIIHPKLLETLTGGLEETDAGLGGTWCLACDERYWNEGREKFLGSEKAPETKFCTFEETMHDVFHGFSPFRMIGGVMMRRDLVGETRFKTDLFIGEDFYFVYENLIKGASSVVLRQKWYLNRIHTGNSSWVYNFDGFYTRFYRRKLVWQSEERCGRSENARYEKLSAVHSFNECFVRNSPYGKDAKRMRAVMKEHKSELLSALDKKKGAFLKFGIYCPCTAWVCLRLMKKFKKR